VYYSILLLLCGIIIVYYLLFIIYYLLLLLYYSYCYYLLFYCVIYAPHRSPPVYTPPPRCIVALHTLLHVRNFHWLLRFTRALLFRYVTLFVPHYVLNCLLRYDCCSCCCTVVYVCIVLWVLICCVVVGDYRCCCSFRCCRYYRTVYAFDCVVCTRVLTFPALPIHRSLRAFALRVTRICRSHLPWICVTFLLHVVTLLPLSLFVTFVIAPALFDWLHRCCTLRCVLFTVVRVSPRCSAAFADDLIRAFAAVCLLPLFTFHSSIIHVTHARCDLLPLQCLLLFLPAVVYWVRTTRCLFLRFTHISFVVCGCLFLRWFTQVEILFVVLVHIYYCSVYDYTV